MKVLFISVWPLESGIFQSTIPPAVNFWLENDLVESAEVVTFGNEAKVSSSHDGKIVYRIIRVDSNSHPIIRFAVQIKALLRIARDEKFDLIWARTVTSGNLAMLTSFFAKKPFGVESFEPHTDYMVEGKAWKRYSLKAIVQRFLENRIAKRANILGCVSEKYTDIIARKYNRTANSTFSMPCAIDFEQFKFDATQRTEVRKTIGFSDDDYVGIYVGKFGDIYYDNETFQFIKAFTEVNARYKFIIVTEMLEHAERQKRTWNISDDQLLILSTLHSEVPRYLSAADYGICPVKESPSRLYCSPIKTGEYFASGLPVVISRGIGDDSDYIENNRIGKAIDFRDSSSFQFQNLSQKSREEIAHMGEGFRSKSQLFKLYSDIFKTTF